MYSIYIIMVKLWARVTKDEVTGVTSLELEVLVCRDSPVRGRRTAVAVRRAGQEVVDSCIVLRPHLFVL